MSTPEDSWRAASEATVSDASSWRAALKIVRPAPDARATSTARSTATAAVPDPSVPTRIFWYTDRECSGLLLRGPGFSELDRRRLEALDRTEHDHLLALVGLRIGLCVDDHDLTGAELLV